MCPLSRGRSALRPLFPGCVRRVSAAGFASRCFQTSWSLGHRRGHLGCQPQPHPLDRLFRLFRGRCPNIRGGLMRAGSRCRLRPVHGHVSRCRFRCWRWRRGCRLRARRRLTAAAARWRWRRHGRLRGHCRRRADRRLMRADGPDRIRVGQRRHHRSGRDLIQHPERPGDDKQHESGNDPPEQLPVLARPRTARDGPLLLRGLTHFAAPPRLGGKHRFRACPYGYGTHPAPENRADRPVRILRQFFTPPSSQARQDATRHKLPATTGGWYHSPHPSAPRHLSR